MAIGTGAAILGAAVIGAGASKMGADKAARAAGQAAGENAAVNREIYQQTRSDLQPYTRAGYTALNQLMGVPGLMSGGAPAAQPAAANPYGAQPSNTSSAPAVDYAGLREAASYESPHKPLPADAPRSAQPIGATASAPQSGAPPTSAPANPNFDNVDWMAYLKANPDAMANYQEIAASGRSDTLATDPVAFAKNHYVTDGSRRDLPLTASAQAQAGSPAQTSDFTSYGSDAPPRPVTERPEFAEQQPTFTTPTFGAAPNSADYLDWSKFRTDPGYDFRVKEAARGANALYGARGLLKSDAAIRGVMDRSYNLADQSANTWWGQQLQRLNTDQNQYNTDRATTLNQFNADRNTGLAQYNQNRNIFNTNYNYDTARTDQNYDADRAFGANRFDTRTQNLFQLTGIGQNAAAGQAAAGQNYAAGTVANNNSLASVKGNAAIAGANGINSALGGAAMAYGMYSNPFASPAGYANI